MAKGNEYKLAFHSDFGYKIYVDEASPENYRNARKLLKRIGKMRKEGSIGSLEFLPGFPVLVKEDCMVKAGLQKKRERNPYEGVDEIFINSRFRNPELLMSFEKKDHYDRAWEILYKKGRVGGIRDYINASVTDYSFRIHKIKRKIGKILETNGKVEIRFHKGLPEKTKNRILKSYEKKLESVDTMNELVSFH